MRTNGSTKRYRLCRFVGYILFALYVMLLLNLLFFNARYGRISGEKGYNLVPFKTIKNYIKYRHLIMDISITNILGNILAFVPLGFFVPALWRWARWMIITTLFCGFMSIVVEIIQYKYSVGSFDVDDIILNTLGGLIGYIIYKICGWFYRGIFETT